jgi:hypothetical protein
MSSPSYHNARYILTSPKSRDRQPSQQVKMASQVSKSKIDSAARKIRIEKWLENVIIANPLPVGDPDLIPAPPTSPGLASIFRPLKILSRHKSNVSSLETKSSQANSGDQVLLERADRNRTGLSGPSQGRVNEMNRSSDTNNDHPRDQIFTISPPNLNRHSSGNSTSQSGGVGPGPPRFGEGGKSTAKGDRRSTSKPFWKILRRGESLHGQSRSATATSIATSMQDNLPKDLASHRDAPLAHELAGDDRPEDADYEDSDDGRAEIRLSRLIEERRCRLERARRLIERSGV